MRLYSCFKSGTLDRSSLKIMKTTFRIINAATGETVKHTPDFASFDQARRHMGHLLGVVPFAMSVGSFKR
jgi:hypothetical protein